MKTCVNQREFVEICQFFKSECHSSFFHIYAIVHFSTLHMEPDTFHKVEEADSEILAFNKH